MKVMTRQEYNSCVKTLSDRVYRYCLKSAATTAEAEDAVQLAFVKLWNNRETILACKAKSWLFTTAYRNILDERRKDKNRNVLMDYDENMVDADHSQSRYEIREILERALDELPLEQKTAIMLRDYEGYAYEEICEIMDCSLSKVKTLIFRARKKLQSNEILKREILDQ